MSSHYVEEPRPRHQENGPLVKAALVVAVASCAALVASDHLVGILAGVPLGAGLTWLLTRQP